MKRIGGVLVLILVLSLNLSYGQAVEKAKSDSKLQGGVCDSEIVLFAPGFAAKFGHPEVEENHLAKTIKVMDEKGVVCALLQGDNRTVLEWCEKYPERFVPTYSILDPISLINPLGPGNFQKEVKAGKWKALGKVMLPYVGMPINDKVMYPYYEICEKEGLPVFFHCGMAGPAPKAPFRLELANPLLLQDVVRKFPKLRIVICHLGWPWTREATYLAWAYPNVYLNVGAVSWHLSPESFHDELEYVVRRIGPNKILYGTDQIQHASRIRTGVDRIMEAEYLTGEEKGRILGGTFRELFPSIGE